MTAPEPKKAILHWLSTNGLVIALVGSLVGNYFQYRQAQETQKLSFRYQQFDEFKKTSAQLDEVVASYFDALAENRVTPQIKDKFSEIYRKHITRTESDRYLLGVEDTERYLEALGVLRDEIDASNGPNGAGKRIEAFAQVISARRALSDHVIES